MKLFWVAVAGAGAAGTLVRVILSKFITVKYHPTFPWGTFAINISGAFLLGFLVGWGAHHGPSAQSWLTPVSAGFLGSYTTFSTWSLETLRLFLGGRPLYAIANILLSMLAGLSAAALGLLLGTFL